MGTYSGREHGIGLDVATAEGDDLAKLPRLLNLILLVLLTSAGGRSGRGGRGGDGGCAGGGWGCGRGPRSPVLGDGEDGEGLNGQKNAGGELHAGQLDKMSG